MGISTVAIFSEADREALHVSLADESYCIGSPLSKDSYLNMNAILSIALATKSEAIHPGYGFLSESPSFARLCEEHGIIFIGPPAEVISKMGDKDAAKRTMREAGIPVIPGCDLVEDYKKAEQEYEELYELRYLHSLYL
jgi:acetyl-CoA carboxylase biotin carboxylase subunit